MRWHFQRALAWLADAARGELIPEGDHFEIPDFPVSFSDGAVVFLESTESFSHWQQQTEHSGYIELLFLPQQPERFLVRMFRSRDRSELHTLQWGKALKEREGSIHSGIWILLPRPPVLAPWQAPITWRELSAACSAQGIDLLAILRPLVRELRDGEPHILLLGFPIPAKVGEPPCQFHWQAIMLPVLSARGLSAGFRENEEGYWCRDVTRILRREAPVNWVKSENWHEDQIAARGRLPNSLRSQSVLLIGGGALGAVFAELLVRAGVYKLTIIDSDKIEVGNLVRHSLGVPNVDASKAQALAEHINRATPHASVDFLNVEFPNCNEEERARIQQSDLIIDCTGSDDVLYHLGAFSWNSRKVFVSLSLGIGARRLYCFTAQGANFPHEIFVDMLQPWLAKDLTENEGQEFPREGIGCWNPIFPARADDVWMMAAIAIKDLQRFVSLSERFTGLRVYEQTYEDGVFTGVRRVEK